MEIGIAVAIFIVSQVLQHFVFDPITEQRKVFGEIAGALLYLGNMSNVAKARDTPAAWPMEPEEAMRTIRSLAGRLRASLWSIPAYGLWSALGLIHSRDDILAASSELVGWSNSLWDGAPQVYMASIAKLLRLPTS